MRLSSLIKRSLPSIESSSFRICDHLSSSFFCLDFLFSSFSLYLFTEDEDLDSDDELLDDEDELEDDELWY